MKDLRRATDLQLSKYVRTRILNEDRRWASSPLWLCFMFALKLQKAVTSVQGISARLGANATGSSFNPEDPKIQDKLSCAFRKIRGFSQYWQSAKYCLRAHVATFGTPTWFVTLNPDIWHWEDLHAIYAKLTGKPVDKDNIEEVISKDPAPFARFWRRKLKTFLKDVILVENGPLGKVTHYFYRIEYQHRGTQHVHCLFWTAERPSADAKAQEVADFLDAHVTARLPDAEKEPELFDLVSRCQKHNERHTATCKRTQRYKGKPFQTCRFGFPRPILRRTMYFTDENDLVMPTHCQRPYYLARRATETSLNDYSPAILLGWKANVDVQYIPANVKDVLNYVTAYTTKGEKAKRLLRQEADKNITESSSYQKCIYRFAMRMLEQREAGLLEIVDELMGHHNFEFDCGHEFIPTDQADNRSRIVKPKGRVQKDASIYEKNWIDDYYPGRGAKFLGFSLYNMMTQFMVKSATEKELKARETKTAKRDQKAKAKQQRKSQRDEEEVFSDEDDNSDSDNDDALNEQLDTTGLGSEYHINDENSPFYSHPSIHAGDLFAIGTENKGKVFRKRKAVIGRFFFGAIVWDSKESIEEFYRRVVILFVPWTKEETMLADFNAETYTELWAGWFQRLRRTSPDAAADISRLLDAYRDLRKEEETLGIRMEAVRRVMEQLQVEESAEPEAEIQDRQVDAVVHAKNVGQMNEIQSRIFTRFMNHIQHQEEVRSSNEKQKDKKLIEPLPESIRMFLSGTAGTGKSFLIKNLADALTLKYTTPEHSGRRPAVLIAAPTGIAALSIGGNTIHSLFRIEVNTDGERELQPLSQTHLDHCRCLCANAKLIILDEISMCSNIMLLKLHRRLTQISGNVEAPFGGYNILLLGDLLQLPPVKAPQVFERISGRDLRQSFGTVNMNVSMWDAVEYEELTENMRQKGDQAMAGLLGRMRVGSLNGEDVELLRDCTIPAANGEEPTFAEIAKKFVELQAEDPRVMSLFPTNAEVVEMNKAILDLIELQCVVFEAEDSVDERSTRSLRSGTRNPARSRPWQQLSIEEKKKKKATGNNSSKRLDDEDPTMAATREEAMKGGLAKRLTVAVGARVMLRRNLDIARRLVNGATGIVTRIEKENIQVQFDADVPFLHNISRVDGRYQRGAQEVMIRKQFPLVLAYAATCHKAQGMTLQNVLIRPINIFADAMFFVAASRVTSLAGLHLAGFSVTAALKFNAKALTEYNRLRATINLPQVGAAQVEPSVANAVAEERRKTPKRKSNAKVIVATPVSTPRPTPGRVIPPVQNDTAETPRRRPVAPKPKQRAQRVAYDNIQFDAEVMENIPRLRSSVAMPDASIDAAYRAILHTLAMMELVTSTIRSGQADDDGDVLLFNAIQACLERKHRMVWQVYDEMRKHVDLLAPSSRTHFETAIEAVFTVLPEAVRMLVGPSRETTICCSGCSFESRPQITHEPVIWMDRVDGSLATAVDECFEAPRRNGESCAKCGSPLESSFISDVGNRRYEYMISAQLAATSSYTALPQDPVRIGTDRFLLVGVGRLQTASADAEFFYRSPQSGWLQFSEADGEIREVANLKLENFNIFVWKKKEALRRTKAAKEAGQDVEKVYDEFEDIYSRMAFSDDGEEELDEGEQVEVAEEVSVKVEAVVPMAEDPQDADGSSDSDVICLD